MAAIKRRAWTGAERDTVRRLYPTTTAPELARLLGRGVSGVYQLAAKLGLAERFAWPDEVIDRVRDMHARGMTDAAIAAALGVGHDQAKHIRKDRVRVPANRDHDAKRRGVRTQLGRLGVRNTGELRAWSYRRYARESGWPEELAPREVQILNVLAERGPKTRAELAAAIGMRTDRLHNDGKRPVLLAGNGPGGTYTASLLRRGLIAEQRRSRKTGRRGHGRLPSLYTVTAEAIRTREECLERLERGRRAGAGAAGEPEAERGEGGHAGP